MRKTSCFLLGCGVLLLFLLVTCLCVSAATIYIRPNADDTRQWSTTSAFLLHWSEVDDSSPDDDTTYIYSGSPGKYDIFDFPTPSFNGDIPDDKLVIGYVRFYYRCRAFTSGPSTPGVSLKLYADTTHTSDFVEVASHSFGASYATRYSDALYENPCTGTDWTKDDFDDLQVKILLDKVNANGDIARCTQIYVYINYKCEAPVVDYEVPGNGEGGVLFHVDDGVDISFNTSWWGYTPGGTRTVRCYKYISFNNETFSYVGYSQVTNNDTRVWLNESDFDEPDTTYYWRVYCYDLTFASTQYSYRSFTTKDARIIFGQLDGMGGGFDPLYDEVPLNNTAMLFNKLGLNTSISVDYTGMSRDVLKESHDKNMVESPNGILWLAQSFFDGGAPSTFRLTELSLNITDLPVQEFPVKTTIAITNMTEKGYPYYTFTGALDNFTGYTSFWSDELVVGWNNFSFYDQNVTIEEGENYSFLFRASSGETFYKFAIDNTNDYGDGNYFFLNVDTWVSISAVDINFRVWGTYQPSVNLSFEWYNTSLVDWEVYGVIDAVVNGTYTFLNGNFSGFSNLYKWRVSATANDTGLVHSEWYQFKTFVPLSDTRRSVLPEITAFSGLGGLCFGLLWWRRRKPQEG